MPQRFSALLLVWAAVASKNQPKEVVLAYIRALDNREYDKALAHLHETIRIRGPAGETFGKPLDFIEMLR